MYEGSNTKTLYLSDMRLNTIGDYYNMEFYPKNHIFGTDTIVATTSSGTIASVSICIMKINDTAFDTIKNKHVYGSGTCQELYATDAELIQDFICATEPESVLVTLVYEVDLFNFKILPYISDVLSIVNDINDSVSFNEELQQKLDMLING